MVAGYPLRGFHPHFLFGAPKRKRRWSRQKKKRFSLRSYGRGAPCRAAGRGPKRSCSMDAAPARTRAGLLAGYRTWYAVLNKEVIGQNLNLTSYSFRAFRFAKRCPGGRGGGPPFGMVLASIPAHPLAPAGADASLRAGWLGWLIGLSVGVDDLTDAPNFGTKFGRRKPCLRYIGPLPGTTCVAPVGRGDHTPPPGCSARWGRHRSAPIPVGSQTPPPPRVGADLCVRPPPLRVTRPRADTQAGPYGSHCNLHQTQNNGRGQSPAPTGTKGNEHPTPLRDLPGHPKPRLPQPKTPCMTAGTPPSSSVPRPNAKKHPRPSPNRGFQRGPQPPLVVSRGSRGEHRAPAANQRSVCGGKRRSSGMSEPVPFWRRRGI